MPQEKTEELQKPLSIAIKEFKDDISTVINESQLSAIILEMVIKDLYLEIKNISGNQLKLEEESYKEQLNQSKESSK